MYRFQGEDGKVNNYICFGTDDKNTCISNHDKYMYRIIGIVQDSVADTSVSKDMIKVVKQTELVADSEKEFQYDIDNVGYIEAFENTTLYTQINDSSGVFLNSENPLYPYMKDSTWTNKIVNKSWRYEDSLVYSEKEFKIGLIYMEDFKLSGSTDSNCLEDDPCLSNWTSHLGSNISESWSMTYSEYKYGMPFEFAFDYKNGYFKSEPFATPFGVIPVFYLQTDTIIKSGTGSESDPFIIQV